MLLRALNFSGFLDISAPEVLGSTEFEWLGAAAQFRRTMKSGDMIFLPDEYYRFPNIKNAVNAGLLQIVSFDSRPEQIVIHAEVAGSHGIPGTKYVFFDVHGGEDTALIKDVNGVPSLVFDPGCDYRSKWNITVPEDYVAGTPLYVEAFWTFPSGAPADVSWMMEYKVTPPGGPTVGPPGSVSFVQAALVPNQLYTTGTNLVVPPVGLAPGNLLTAAVWRTATDPADTLAAPVYINLVKVNYTGMVFSP